MGTIIRKTHSNGLEYLEIETRLCQGRIFLQGAQITFFQPSGQAPLLWVSEADDYVPGNGIRGGIPVCWPWFGKHANPDFPQHGFARTRVWQMTEADIINEEARLTFTLNIDESDRRYWPHNTEVKIHFRLGTSLTVTLENLNQGCEPVTLTQALHSYFPIGDIHQLTACGFVGANYIEFGQGPLHQDTDEVRFNRETDRVYCALGAVQQLKTPSGTIEVCRENSRSAVLWNPWIAKSKQLARFKDTDYLSMVCLEAANVREDSVVLAPGQCHQLSTHIRWV